MKIVGSICSDFKKEENISGKNLNLYKESSKKFLFKIKNEQNKTFKENSFCSLFYSSDDLSDYENISKKFKIDKENTSIEKNDYGNSVPLNIDMTSDDFNDLIKQSSLRTLINWINLKFSKLKLKKDDLEIIHNNNLGKFSNINVLILKALNRSN